jgi:general secretion pathway protein G
MKESGMWIHRERRHGGARGFSLIELLIVMIILGLLASLVGPRLFQHVGQSKQKTARAQIELLGTALDAYRLDVGKYPTTEQGLAALRQAPAGVEKWNGPYLPRDVPADPWGNVYVYKSPGDQGPYDLYSLGADGRVGGEGEDKDVRSWEN